MANNSPPSHQPTTKHTGVMPWPTNMRSSEQLLGYSSNTEAATPVIKTTFELELLRAQVVHSLVVFDSALHLENFGNPWYALVVIWYHFTISWWRYCVTWWVLFISYEYYVTCVVGGALFTDKSTFAHGPECKAWVSHPLTGFSGLVWKPRHCITQRLSQLLLSLSTNKT